MTQDEARNKVLYLYISNEEVALKTGNTVKVIDQWLAGTYSLHPIDLQIIAKL